MDSFSSILTVISLIMSSQGFGILFLLSKTKTKSSSVFILMSLVLILTIIVISIIIQQHHFINFVPHLLLIHQPLIFTIFPLFYLYVLKVTNSDFHLNYTSLLHLTIPFLVLLNLGPYYLLTGTDKIGVSALNLQIVNVEWKWYLIILCLSGLVYSTKSLLLIRDHLGSMKNFFSFKATVDLGWLRNGQIILFIAWIIVLMRLITKYRIDTQLISLTLLSLVIVIIGYNGWKYYEINTFIGSVKKEKYLKSGLSNELAKKHLSGLLLLVESKKLYKNDRLNIQDVSEELNVPIHHVSQIINQHLGFNFFDFINRYRVDEAKKLLKEDDNNPTILAIAYEVGFNSKSAFYAAFKKHTGCTPSMFKKNES